MCHLRLMVMLGTEPELCAHWTSRQLTYELSSFLPLKQPYYVALNLSQPCFRPECWNCKAALSHLLPLVLTSGSEEFGLSFSVRNDENVNCPPPQLLITSTMPGLGTVLLWEGAGGQEIERGSARVPQRTCGAQRTALYPKLAETAARAEKGQKSGLDDKIKLFLYGSEHIFNMAVK